MTWFYIFENNRLAFWSTSHYDLTTLSGRVLTQVPHDERLPAGHTARLVDGSKVVFVPVDRKRKKKDVSK